VIANFGNMNLPKFLPVLAILGLTNAGAFAQAVVPTYNNYTSILGGATADYQWSGYSSETRPAGVAGGTSGATSQWLSGLAPNGGAGGILFSGNGSFGSDTTDFISAVNGGGIYSFFSQTHFQISSSVPLSNMESLVVQLSIAEGLSGAFGGSAVALAAAPTLTLVTSTGTVSNIAPSYSLLATQYAAVVNGSNTNVDLFNYQWDLSGITGTAQSYTINWQAPYHGEIFGQDVTESSAVHSSNVLVPEPSAGIAALGGMGMLVASRRVRRTAIA
jgi:hypothetical protein